MRKSFFRSLMAFAVLGILVIGSAFAAQAADKATVQFVKIDSTYVKDDPDLGFQLILPPGYDAKKGKYPVLYLLHGHGGMGIDWIEQGKLIQTYEQLLAEGKIGEMIIVCPNSGGDKASWYINWKGQKNRNYEDYMIRDIIAKVESTYPVIKSAKGRGIAGFSMGGYGAYMLALRHPEMFEAVTAFAGALNFVTVAQGFDRETLQNAFSNEITALLDYNPADILNNLFDNKPELFEQRYFNLVVGTKDFLYTHTVAMENQLKNLGANYEVKYLKDEEHNWDFVSKALPDVLTFQWNHMK